MWVSSDMSKILGSVGRDNLFFFKFEQGITFILSILFSKAMKTSRARAKKKRVGGVAGNQHIFFYHYHTNALGLNAKKR